MTFAPFRATLRRGAITEGGGSSFSFAPLSQRICFVLPFSFALVRVRFSLNQSPPKKAKCILSYIGDWLERYFHSDFDKFFFFRRKP
jgi:hypothetical protein